MASAPKSVWAIDVGNSSLKAICFRQAGENLEVVDNIVIEHSLILSAPDVDETMREQAISSAIEKLASERDLTNQQLIISVAGQTSFARFIKLPPVEEKKIPKMVAYEAEQQIPFDIQEVEWDYQMMTDSDSPDALVGIFAIKNDLIASILSHYTENSLRVSAVQMSPVCLYNFACYEYSGITSTPKKATILLDMGTDNTNLVICSGKNVWQRCIPMGGNSFTQAIASAFNISFDKAEKLKRGAQTSKYAKQIFQAMRPVYTKLSEEVQRSIGFYLSSGNVEFVRVVAIGGGFKLQGVAKFLQQSLGIKMVLPTEFKKITLGEGVNAAKFHENILDFGVAYGLGVQGASQAAIETNLLPRKLARIMNWKQKSNYVNIAAIILVAVAVLAFGRAMKDKVAYATNSSQRSAIAATIGQAQQVQSRLSEQQDRSRPLTQKMERYFGYFEGRDVLPSFVGGLVSCLPNAENTPDYAHLYQAFNAGDVETISRIPRGERKQIFVTKFSIDYVPSVAGAAFGQTRTRTTRAADTGMGGMGMDMGMGMPGMGMDMGMGMGMPGMGMPGMGMDMGMPGMSDFGRTDDSAVAADGAGFIIEIEGYSPFENFGMLMDPPGVADDQSRWGLITRLENFKKIYTRKKFKLFEKDSSNHFVYEYGEVDIKDSKMPVGIGKEVTKVRVETTQTDGARRTSRAASDRVIEKEQVLIDPMTGEEMSKTFKLDSNGVKQFDEYGEEIIITRDHWFRIKAKFLWEDAPEKK